MRAIHDIPMGRGLYSISAEKSAPRVFGKMRVKSMTAAGWAALPLAGACARAAVYDVGSIHVAQPWVRATPKGASSGAAYLTVTNSGSAPDVLTCAGTDAAAQCQIHSMSMENGVIKMRPVEGGLEIKPGETVTLKPGSDHMMFVNLKHPLRTAKHRL